MKRLQLVNFFVGVLYVIFMLLLSRGTVYYSTIAWTTTFFPVFLAGALLLFVKKWGVVSTICCGFVWTIVWFCQTFLGMIAMRGIYFVSLGPLGSFDPAWFLYITFSIALINFAISPLLALLSFLGTLSEKRNRLEKNS